MHDYRLSTRQGLIGPVRLETLRDLAEAGLVAADAEVSRDGGPFVAFAALPELTGLAGAAETVPRYSGDLAISSFLRVLLRLAAEEATGRLEVRDGARRKDVFLERGRPVFVGSSMAKERLGELLIASGELAPEALGAALGEASARLEPLGAALGRLGILPTSQVRAGLLHQQILRLVDLCGWETGRYAFLEGERHDGPPSELALEARDLGLLAARELPEGVIIRRLSDVLTCAVDLNASALGPGLEPEETLAVAALDGEHTAVQVLTEASGSSARRRAVLAVLYLGWELGALRPRPARKPVGSAGR